MAVEKCVYENRYMDAWMDEWIRARASTHLLSEEVVAALGAGAAAGEREQGKRPRRHRLLVHTLDLPAHVEPLTLIMSTIFVIAMD